MFMRSGYSAHTRSSGTQHHHLAARVLLGLRDVLAPECLAHLTAAVELYSEDFLAGFTLPDSPTFDEWQFFQRESLRQLSKIVQESALGNSKIKFVFNSSVEEVIGTKEGGITSLKLRNLKTNAVTDFAAQGLFVAIGHTPNTQAYAGQLELDERG